MEDSQWPNLEPEKTRWSIARWARVHADPGQCTLGEAVGKVQPRQEAAKEHEKSLLGKNACLQGEDENVSKAVDRGTQEEKEAKSTPHLGWGFTQTSRH